MKERGILFNAEMVRAILDGTQTQTRRVVKPQPEFFEPDAAVVYGEEGHSGPGWYFHSDEYPDEGSLHYRCPYGVPGDRLWVRETFNPRYFDGGKPAYRADWDGSASDVVTEPKWTPSIHMPRWASRIDLDVTGVRVERVQEISHNDALAEGIERYNDDGAIYYGPFDHEHADPLHEFERLWDAINVKRGLDGILAAHSWDANPWVWVVEFRRV